MKITAILLSVLLGSVQSANAQSSYHVKPGVDMLICKATGKVDGITSLFLTETNQSGQLCGGFKKGEAVASALCIKGDLTSDLNVLEAQAVQYGENTLSLRYHEKTGFSLVKAFECDWNHEEKCLPGVEEVLAEEVMDCYISKLKY